jgi:hypothetical protein
MIWANWQMIITDAVVIIPKENKNIYSVSLDIDPPIIIPCKGYRYITVTLPVFGKD